LPLQLEGIHCHPRTVNISKTISIVFAFLKKVGSFLFGFPLYGVQKSLNKLSAANYFDMSDIALNLVL
jgi:hypothetical protein